MDYVESTIEKRVIVMKTKEILGASPSQLEINFNHSLSTATEKNLLEVIESFPLTLSGIKVPTDHYAVAEIIRDKKVIGYFIPVENLEEEE
jgi:hypothetical protein